MDMQEVKSGAEVATQGVNALSKFASTIGEIYYIFGGKAREIRQIADANAYAETLAAETESKVAMIKAQGAEDVAQFVLAKESRKMQNTLSVVEKAEDLITPEDMATEEPVNQDWLNRFFTIVEDVSDDEMQKLWAQILAGEVKQPKSYSLRTLDVLRNMTQEDAKLFANASDFIIDYNSLCTDEFSLPLEDVVKLGEIGLVNANEIFYSKNVELNDSSHFIISKCAVLFINNVMATNLKIELNVKYLTAAGIELLRLIPKSSPNMSFISAFAQHCKTKGSNKVTLHKICSWKDGKVETYDKREVIV